MRVRKSAKDRKRDIKQATLRLAFQVGPAAVTTGMIATELGLSQPAIYKHYPTKEDLWVSIVGQLSDLVKENIARVNMAQLLPEARIKALVLDHLCLLQENPAMPELMTLRDTKNTQQRVRLALHSSMTAFRDGLEDAIKAAIQDGRFRADLKENDAATLVFGIIQSLALRMMVTRNTDILLQDGERLLDLLLVGFKGER